MIDEEDEDPGVDGNEGADEARPPLVRRANCFSAPTFGTEDLGGAIQAAGVVIEIPQAIVDVKFGPVLAGRPAPLSTWVVWPNEGDGEVGLCSAFGITPPEPGEPSSINPVPLHMLKAVQILSLDAALDGLGKTASYDELMRSSQLASIDVEAVRTVLDGVMPDERFEESQPVEAEAKGGCEDQREVAREAEVFPSANTALEDVAPVAAEGGSSAGREDAEVPEDVMETESGEHRGSSAGGPQDGDVKEAPSHSAMAVRLARLRNLSFAQLREKSVAERAAAYGDALMTIAETLEAAEPDDASLYLEEVLEGVVRRGLSELENVRGPGLMRFLALGLLPRSDVDA